MAEEMNGDEKRITLGTFICNICGARNRSNPPANDRELPTCAKCRSSIRFRSVVLALSRALFGLDLPLSEFPTLKSIRGLGVSDSEIYADYLEKIFSYTNTFYHREPRLDLLNPDPSEFGRYDFVICSDVLEHVPEPVEPAFATLAKLLKPTGVLIFTVPYSLEPDTVEHYPGLAETGFAEIDGRTIMIGRTAGGEYKVFDRLVFHGGPGATLEHRLFAEDSLRRHLSAAGFPVVEINARECRKFGVVFSNPCSLPVIASRGPFSLTASGVRELVEQLSSSRWLRLARLLGLGPVLAKRFR